MQKGFGRPIWVLGWVFAVVAGLVIAYTWTPLDVEDRLKAALRLVESKS
jgi:hypothetical protein